MNAKPPPPGSKARRHKKIRNPIDLKRKVAPLSPVAAAARLKNAEEVMAKVVADFADKIEEDLRDLERLFAIWAVDRRDRNLEPIRRIIHNMRGQGATFGFDLITAIGASFDRYMQEHPPDKPVSAELVRQHVEAIRAVYRRDIKGHGDTVAQAVVDALNAAVDKTVGSG